LFSYIFIHFISLYFLFLVAELFPIDVWTASALAVFCQQDEKPFCHLTRRRMLESILPLNVMTSLASFCINCVLVTLDRSPSNEPDDQPYKKRKKEVSESALYCCCFVWLTGGSREALSSFNLEIS
jgi:hypothetical protein